MSRSTHSNAPTAHWSRLCSSCSATPTKRTRLFTDASGGIIVVTLSDYPFELFAASSVGARLSSDNVRGCVGSGARRVAECTASIPLSSPQQILLRMRRGRIEVLVSALAKTQEQAQDTGSVLRARPASAAAAGSYVVLRAAISGTERAELGLARCTGRRSRRSERDASGRGGRLATTARRWRRTRPPPHSSYPSTTSPNGCAGMDERSRQCR